MVSVESPTNMLRIIPPLLEFEYNWAVIRNPTDKVQCCGVLKMATPIFTAQEPV